MIHHLKMTVLVDNTAMPLFLCEWGLSILIDTDDTRILLDTCTFSLIGARIAIRNSDPSFRVIE